MTVDNPDLRLIVLSKTSKARDIIPPARPAAEAGSICVGVQVNFYEQTRVTDLDQLGQCG